MGCWPLLENLVAFQCKLHSLVCPIGGGEAQVPLLCILDSHHRTMLVCMCVSEWLVKEANHVPPWRFYYPGHVLHQWCSRAVWHREKAQRIWMSSQQSSIAFQPSGLQHIHQPKHTLLSTVRYGVWRDDTPDLVHFLRPKENPKSIRTVKSSVRLTREVWSTLRTPGQTQASSGICLEQDWTILRFTSQHYCDISRDGWEQVWVEDKLVPLQTG